MRGKPKLANSASAAVGITPAGAGKTMKLTTAATVSTGSPPQVRGKLLYPLSSISCNGITPAGAGKTIGEHCEALKTRDHPRRCGENCPYFEPVWGDRGSPPQVRGKQCAFSSSVSSRRITPAGAGKTVSSSSRPYWLEDHPRRCGENRFRGVLRPLRLGSPPQVRGKHRKVIQGVK
mgnify:CR=1 FL=1